MVFKTFLFLSSDLTAVKDYRIMNRQSQRTTHTTRVHAWTMLGHVVKLGFGQLTFWRNVCMHCLQKKKTMEDKCVVFDMWCRVDSTFTHNSYFKI